VLVHDNAPELRLVREWLHNWSGPGLIIAGMTYQGWDGQLAAYAARDWRANFFPVGIAQSLETRAEMLVEEGDLRASGCAALGEIIGSSPQSLRMTAAAVAVATSLSLCNSSPLR
jgi:hypothetical protein